MKIENCNKVAGWKARSWFCYSIITVVNNNQLSFINLPNDSGMSYKKFHSWKCSPIRLLVYWQKIFQSSLNWFQHKIANFVRPVVFIRRLKGLFETPVSISDPAKVNSNWVAACDNCRLLEIGFLNKVHGTVRTTSILSWISRTRRQTI